MIKELVISTFIVVLICVGNIFTENYTTQSVENTSKNLEELRTELLKDESEIDFRIAKEKIDQIHEKWDLKYEKLAYYIEHDELEKVETELTGLRGYIQKEESSEALPSIDRSIFILEHIKNKTQLNLKNIF